MEVFFTHLGATAEEMPGLLSRLRGKWEQLGVQTDIQLPFSIPGPLSEEQVAAFEAALREQAAHICGLWKEDGARTLLEFAKLEYQLLRVG
jgi:hypothetical protein